VNRHAIAKEQTREKIQNAYIELLQTVEYEAITVREIAEQAGIGFKTFYRHYNDKDDLTRAVYQRLWQEFVSQIDLASPDVRDNETNIRQLLRVTRDYQHLVRAILAIRAHTELVSEVAQQVSRMQLQLLHPDAFSDDDPLSQKILDVITARFITGQFDLIKWWVDDNFSLSLDIMTTLILKLVVEPIISLDILALKHEANQNRDEES